MQNINRKSEDGELTSSAALLILWKTVSLLAFADFLHVHSFTYMALRFNLSSSYFLKCYSFRFLVRCPLLQTCVTCPLICVFVQQVQVSSCFFFSTPRCPQRCHPRTPSLLHDILQTVAVTMIESGKLYFQTGWYSCLINSLVSLNFFISDWFTA